MSKFLITGVAGFVGSTLAETLLNGGHKVIGIDDLSTGLLENMQTFLQNPNFKFIKQDISNPREMENLDLGEEEISGVFHFAALSRIPLTVKDPEKSHNINITGLFNVLQLMRRVKIPKIVYSSSAAVYGSNSYPQIENMKEECLNPYALGKYVGEHYIKTFCKMHEEIDGVCLRYFNIWGAKEMLLTGVAPIIGLFFKKLLQDKTPVTIVGDGKQSRDYVHVSDIVKANILAMKCEKRLAGDHFNIGTGQNFTILEISDMVLKSLDLSPETHRTFIPAVAHEIAHMKANNDKAKNILGWEPSVILTQEAINNHRNYYLKKWDIK